MAVTGLIGETIGCIQTIYTLAVAIRYEKDLHDELVQRARDVCNDLTFIKNILNQLTTYTHKITVNDEIFVIDCINSVRSAVDQLREILDDILKSRNIFQKLSYRKEEMLTKLENRSTRLNVLCSRLEQIMLMLDRISPELLPMPDFKKQFAQLPEKDVSFFDFIIDQNTSEIIQKIVTDEFNSNKDVYYMKVHNKQFFVGHHSRTWLTTHSHEFILEDRITKFRLQFNQIRLPKSLPVISQASSESVASNTDTHKKLIFSEYYMANDTICGLEVSKTNVYIATKYTIIIVELVNKEILAEYGLEGDGPNRFKQIGSILIPADDTQSLYVIDRGQYRVYKYKINDTDGFEYVRDYKINTKHNQPCYLVSCAIFTNRLYVSDKANNCLHIFPIDAVRQSHCLKDKAIRPFSPGALCAYENYLYVANCSSENPGILLLNADGESIYWFRNDCLKEILTMDMDRNLGELFILTYTTVKSKKQLLILSMSLFRPLDMSKQ